MRDVEGPKKALKQLLLMEKASESISDGDLVDSLIHGSVLLPLFPIVLLMRYAVPNSTGH